MTGFTLFSTSSDIALDCLYVATEPFASEILWFAALACIILPNVALFFGIGAFRPIVSYPWLSYAWHTVKTIRGRRPWGKGIDGFQLGLAFKMQSWDDPLLVIAFIVYTLILRPVLSLALFLGVFVYVFAVRPALCLLALVIASNLRLAVFPKVMDRLVRFVQHPPRYLFGVALDEIDGDFHERIRVMEKRANKAAGDNESVAPLAIGGPVLTPLGVPVNHSAYRWNVTLLFEIMCESMPQLILAILNELQMQRIYANRLDQRAPGLSTTFILSAASSAFVIIITIYPLAFWLVIGKCVEKDKSLVQVLSVPIFPLTKEQVEQRKQNLERIKFMQYNTEASSGDKVSKMGHKSKMAKEKVASPSSKTAVALSASAPAMSLAQAAQILKGELGLEGNVSNIVKQAAYQLGIAADHQPLVEVAKQCLQKLGIGMVATAPAVVSV